MSADCDKPGESGDPPEQLKGEEMGTFGSWTGPKNIFKKVKEWGMDCECDDSKIGAFIQYSSTLAQTEAEERLLFEWVLKLVTLYVTEVGWDGWEAGPATWDWSKLDMGNLWEVPPPDWAVERERGQMGVSVMGKELAAKEGAGVKEGEWDVNGEKEGKQGAVAKVENYSEYGGDGRRGEGGGEGFGGGGGGEGYGEERGGESYSGEVGGKGYGGECGYDGGEGRGREGESWRGDG